MLVYRNKDTVMYNGVQIDFYYLLVLSQLYGSSLGFNQSTSMGRPCSTREDIQVNAILGICVHIQWDMMLIFNTIQDWP